MCTPEGLFDPETLYRFSQLDLRRKTAKIYSKEANNLLFRTLRREGDPRDFSILSWDPLTGSGRGLGG